MLSNDAPFKLVRAYQLLKNSQKFPSKGCLYKFPGSFFYAICYNYNSFKVVSQHIWPAMKTLN